MKFKRTTVAEIAKIAHLSPATVSRTLNHPELVSPTTSALVHSTINLLNSKAEPPIPDASDILQILVNIPDDGLGEPAGVRKPGEAVLREHDVR